MEYYSIFNDISNKTRLEIIRKIRIQPLTLSQLSKQMGTSIQALRKHTNRLQNSGLIDNSSGHLLSISTIGSIVLNQIPYFEFLQKHGDFFKTHELGDVPKSFLQQMVAFSNVEFVDGMMPNFTRWRKMIQSAKKYVYGIFTEPPILIADDILPKLPKIELKLIFGKNSTIPVCNEFIEKLNLKKYQPQSVIQRRRHETVKLNIIITEKYASVMFPFSSNNADMTKTFTGKNKLFHDWSMKFFQQKWKESEPFSRLVYD